MKNFIIFIVITIALLFITESVVGQKTVDADGIESIVADIYEQMSEDSEVELDYTILYEELMALSENPIGLNTASKSELEKMLFLSDIQIDNLMYYRYKSGGFNTLYELQLVDGIDMSDIRMLLPFVVLDEKETRQRQIKLANVLRYGKNEIYIRGDKGVETAEGYQFRPEEDVEDSIANAKKYVGDPYYTHFKYRFSYGNRIAVGFTSEKDAGEQFWGEYNKGYDSYTGYLELKDIGRFKSLIVGNYRANFGEGLVMYTDFSMGKSAYVLNVNARSTGLKKFSSTAEYNFFRGAGATIKWGDAEITGFYSHRMVDGDTLAGAFPTILQSGLHRTINELNKKHNVAEQLIGANLTYTYKQFQVGATMAHIYLDHSLSPKPTIYNQFYFSGKSQTAGSVNYRFNWHKLSFRGETAITDQTAMATTNTLMFQPISTVSLVGLYRNFSPRYNALFANTFSETSRIANERGLYIGTIVHPIRYWTISAYIDSYRFPWFKFGVYSPSIGKDYLAQLDYVPRHYLKMYWRFKYEEKGANDTKNSVRVPLIASSTKWSARYQLSYRIGRNIRLKNQVDVTGASKGSSPTTLGYSILQDFSYQFKRIPLKFDFRYHIFDVPSFDNRIYVYEKDILYAFSVPMFYGVGSRYYFNLKYSINKNLSVWLKLAQTTYADRTSIGSSNTLLQGNRKTDIRFLVRCKF